MPTTAVLWGRDYDLQDMEHALRQAVEVATRRADAGAAVRAVYEAVAVEIDRQRPTCVLSGRCCRFEEYGHRLFVTTLELAAFAAGKDQLQRMREPANGATSLSSFVLQPSSLLPQGAGCPFQIGKLCGVHAIRPFGCRMFFCDPSAAQWQNDAYEQFHAQLKALHETLDVPYFYVEWRQALRIMDWPRPVGVPSA